MAQTNLAFTEGFHFLVILEKKKIYSLENIVLQTWEEEEENLSLLKAAAIQPAS